MRTRLLIPLLLGATLAVTPAVPAPSASAFVPPKVTNLQHRIVVPATVTPSKSFPLRHSWVGVAGSVPICSYTLRRWDYDGSFTDRTTTKQWLVDVGRPSLPWYNVRATDCAGHVSEWEHDPYMTLVVESEQAATYSPGWAKEQAQSALDHSLRVTTRPGASAIVPDAPGGWTDEAGIVARKGPSGGILGVYVGGVLKAKVNLYSAMPTPRQVVAQAFVYSDSGTLTARLVNLSSPQSARRQIALDGFILRGGD